MKKMKVCFLTSSRADFGHLLPLMTAVKADPAFQMRLVATGSHFVKDFGMTYRAIEEKGFHIDEKMVVKYGGSAVLGATGLMGVTIKKFSAVLERLKPDLLILLGDRYEALACAQAALIAKVPIAHLGGGDTTLGAFDEAIRHSITKMAHLHFVTHEEAAKRVRQLGENPRFIFNVGSLAVEQIRNTELLDKKQLEHALDFQFKRRNLLITLHPETLGSGSSIRQTEELLNALNKLGNDTGLLFTASNMDPEGLKITNRFRRYAASRKNSKLFISLGEKLYFSVIRQVDAVVGNSSSGIYEVPSFKKPTVNIGDRQKGRPQASSVINSIPEKKAILIAIKKAFSIDCKNSINPYGDGYSSKRILQILREIKKPKNLLKKGFFDLGEARREPVYIIAEAGVNHNGSLELAKKLVLSASKAGADAVKFQTFKADRVVTKDAPKAEYQQKATGSHESQWEMIKKLELSNGDHFTLARYARKLNIDFLSAPFDDESADFLIKKLMIGRIKIPSGEITNAPLLLRVARSGRPIILSTGMSTLADIERALGVIAFGYSCPVYSKPDLKAFQTAFSSNAGQEALRAKVVLLHCVTQYPTPYNEVNLRAMQIMRDYFGLPVGLSDHSLGIAVPIAATACGATMLEKHLTLDKGMRGPDHAASLEPAEFWQMVQGVRAAEASLGQSLKMPTSCEVKNLPIARKSLIASKHIRCGQPFSADNITIKRPGDGLSPFLYWEIIKKRASRDFWPDEAIAVGAERMQNKKLGINFKKLPLWKGLQLVPGKKRLYPFSLGWDKRGFIRQTTNANVQNKVKEAYASEEYTFITQPPGASEWANRLGDRYVEFIKMNYGSLRGKKILEIGAASTYIAEKLVTECRVSDYLIMDPAIKEQPALSNIRIRREYFTERTVINKKFDLVISLNCLEHVPDPILFLRSLRKLLLKNGGKAILVFPDNEKQFARGDLNAILHEHISYHTRKTAENMFRAAGLRILAAVSEFDTFSFLLEAGNKPLFQEVPEDEILAQAANRFRFNLHHTKTFLRACLKKGEVVAVHGATNGLNNFLAVAGLGNESQVKIYDGDKSKAGKYLPLCPSTIRYAKDVEYRKADRVLISAMTYYEEISRFLREYHNFSEDKIGPLFPLNGETRHFI